MALLRESSRAAGQPVDVVEELAGPGSAILQGAELVRFAEAATRRSPDLDDARMAVRSAMGEAATRAAALTVAAFSGLVRVADATGIQVDDTTFAVTVAARSALGIDGFGGATSTRVDATSVAVPDHFDDAYQLFR